MKLSELAALMASDQLQGDLEINSISIDTRTLKAGDVYIAIKGENHDGHAFIEHAIECGAAGIIVSNPIDCSLPHLWVTDTRKALGIIAAEHRQQFDCPVIALTGSCGKTTVKNMIAAILQEMGSTLSTAGNYNNDIGAPLTLLRLTSEHEYAVLELGANHPGEIAYITRLVKPDVALITNVAPAHLEGFGCLEGVAQAKAEIFQGLSSTGTALINADDQFADYWQQLLSEAHVVCFGMKQTAEVKAKLNAWHQHVFPELRLQTPLGEIDIQCPLPGQHQVYNVLAAAAAVLAVGASHKQIKAGIEGMAQSPGRLQILQAEAGFTVIDDSYNANPGSVDVALQTLQQFPGPRIFVLGDLGELGPSGPEYLKQIGLDAKHYGVNALYSCGDLSQHASDSFGEGAQHFAQQEDLITTLKSTSLAKAVLLIKGSRSAAMENVVKALIGSTA